MTDRLPSWRPGPTRDAITDYLDGIGDVPVEHRLAFVDNDGTMWCERPQYVQADFFVDGVRRRAADDPTLAQQPELAAVLDNDAAKMGELGMARIALAMAKLFDGLTPDEFAAEVDAFAEAYRHPTLDVPIGSVVYQPMLELLAELRANDFTIGLVTGGGTEFVRRVGPLLYDVPPELVVGTLIGYEFGRDDQDHPQLRRTTSLMGDANEGHAKVEHIQAQLGRAPIVAIGNSGGDREMLEWANAGPHPGLALLIDHDDGDREFAYTSTAVTFEESEPITAVADRLGWTTVSMARDWEKVFASR